jgi:hypothetical protein
MIAVGDLELLRFTDDIDDAVTHLTLHAKRSGKIARPPRQLRILGESRR